MKISFKLQGLTYEACVKLCEIKIKKIHGITNIKYNVSKGVMDVESEGQINLGQIQAALSNTPYQATAL
jgi:copper chaperone CopZ